MKQTKHSEASGNDKYVDSKVVDRSQHKDPTEVKGTKLWSVTARPTQPNLQSMGIYASILKNRIKMKAKVAGSYDVQP